MTEKLEPREVRIVHPSYQPRKAELKEDVRIKAESRQSP